MKSRLPRAARETSKIHSRRIIYTSEKELACTTWMQILPIFLKPSFFELEKEKQVLGLHNLIRKTDFQNVSLYRENLLTLMKKHLIRFESINLIQLFMQWILSMLITSAKAQVNVVNIISSLSLEMHGSSSFPFPWDPVRHGPYFPLLVAQVVNGTALRMEAVTPSPHLTAGQACLYCAQKPYEPETEPLQPFIFYLLPQNFDPCGWKVKKYPPPTGIKFEPSSAKIGMVISE